MSPGRPPSSLLWGLAFLIPSAACDSEFRAASGSAERTAQYIAELDPGAIERRGLDFTSSRYDAVARMGRPVEELDPKRDYDFDRLESIEARLAGVNRTEALEHLFRSLTRDAADDRACHIAVLRFLHRASLHGAVLNTRRRDGSRVADPLLLLETNEMRCGNVSRLAVDLLNAGGYEARIVEFAGHTAAEVRYGGGWHFVDADGVGGEGQTAFLPDGTIPSWRELSERPGLLDALPYQLELAQDGSPRTASLPARSVKCFFGDTTRDQHYAMKRGALDEGEFGWDSPRRDPVDWELRERPLRTQPGAVVWRSVEVMAEPGPARVRLVWHPAKDTDEDLLGYRVFVGRTSRGWSYSKFAGEDGAARYWNDVGGWQPEMAPALYRSPPSDIARITVSRDEREVELEVPTDGALFVTVMAFDAYHEAAGRELYLSSNELRIDRSP